MKAFSFLRFVCAAFLCLLLQAAFGPFAPLAYAGSPVNLLSNPGFEQTSSGVPADWSPIGQSWGGHVQVVQAAVYSGSYGLSIQTQVSNNPWVSQLVPVDEGATYAFESHFKSVGIDGKAGFKIEYYTSPVVSAESAAGSYTHYFTASSLDGEWHRESLERTIPAGVTHAKFYLRLYGTGQAYFDDAAITKLYDPPQVIVATDHVHYYTDQTAGRIDVELVPQDNVFAGKTVEVSLLDPSNTVLFSQTGIAASETLAVTFDPQLLTLLEQPHRVIVAMRDDEAQVIEQREKTIYRWERPTSIPQNGPIIVDGEPFFPVIAYHPSLEDYPYLQQIGVNTVQGVRSTSIYGILSYLNAAHENNLKVLLHLYSNMQVKENFELTEKMVTWFRDHPAVLGYMIMDEPVYRGIAQEELLEAYRLIRSLDPNHPTYIVENYDYAYRSTGQATDILVTDVYPYPSTNPKPISAVGDGVRNAIAAVDDVKPVWAILQTFYFPGSTTWNYLPTIEEVRNMAYQAVLAGGTGLGYYSINDPGWALRDSELWDGLVDFKEEIELIGDLVTEGSKIRENIAGPVQWGVWQTGSQQYIVAINTSKDVQNVSIPFEQTGNIVELLYGAQPSQSASWDANLQVQLGSEQTYVYRITPVTAEVEAIEGAIDKYETAGDVQSAFADQLRYRLDIIGILLSQGEAEQATAYLDDMRAYMLDPSVAAQTLISPQAAADVAESILKLVYKLTFS